MERLYKCAEVAERYRVKIETVREWIKKGRLSAVRIGRLYRIRESDLKKFEQRGLKEVQQ